MRILLLLLLLLGLLLLLLLLLLKSSILPTYFTNPVMNFALKKRN